MSADSADTDPGKPRQRVVLVTASPFWIKGNGLAARTRELVLFLSRHYELCVAYLYSIGQADVSVLQGMGARFELVFLGERGSATSEPALVRRFRHFFNASSPSAVYIVVKTELSFLLDAIPGNARTLLDTNDLVSDRTQSMAAHQVQDTFPLTVAQEIALLRRYDRVICIQPSEHDKVASWLGADKVVLAPHPVAVVALPLRETASALGFVASRWHANVDGLRWFMEHVWPLLAGTNLRLDVYGYVGEAFTDLQVSGIRFHGFIDDLDACYAQIDIAINPVRYGAGLKIKTVEAMAHGLPLVVSRQGASGLEMLAGDAFLVADDAEAFASHIKALAGSLSLRQSIAHTAQAQAALRFGPEHCFRQLMQEVDCLTSDNRRDDGQAANLPGSAGQPPLQLRESR
jgi:glycosyltransferase involved in cell wall biosynthesis